MRNRDRFTRPFEGIDEYAKLVVQPRPPQPAPLPADAVLYLPLTDETFTDHSISAKTVTNNTVASSGAAYHFGTSSALFDSTSDSLSIADSADFAFGTTPFAISMWVKDTKSYGGNVYTVLYEQWESAANQVVFGMYKDGNGAFHLYGYVGVAGSAIFYLGVLGSGGVSIDPITTNWTHWAWSFTGSEFYVYRDGTRVANLTCTITWPDLASAVSIGNSVSSPSNALVGYLQEVLVIKGSNNRWTGSTIPVPSAPYTTTTTTPVYSDTSFYSKAITTAGTISISIPTIAGAFNDGAILNGDGSNTTSYIETPDHIDFAFSSDPRYADAFKFCIEIRVSPYGSNQHGGFYQQYVDANNYILFRSYDNGGTKTLQFKVRASSTTIADYSCAYTMSAGTWYHLAVVRDDTGIKVKVNGIDQTLTVTQAIGSTAMPDIASVLRIGYDAVGDRSFYGYMQEIRVSKGTDRYDYVSGRWNDYSNRTRSYLETPYKYGIDKYTQLFLPLSDAGNTFLDQSFYNRAITNTSSVSSTAQVKFGGGSAYCSGAGKYLYTPTLGLASGDFAIDLFIYYVAGYADACPVTTANTIVYTAILWRQSGLFMSTSGVDWQINNIPWATGVTIGQWCHLALVRSGTNVYVYVNGTRTLSSSISGTLANENGFWINNDIQGNGNNAYYSNVRVSKGTDRGWTGSTITVPTSPYAIQTAPRQILDRFPTNADIPGSDVYAAVYTPPLTKSATSQTSKWPTFSNYTPYGVCTTNTSFSGGTSNGTFYWLGTCGYHRDTGGSPIIVMSSQFTYGAGDATRVAIWIDTSNYIRAMRTLIVSGTPSPVYTKSTNPIATGTAPLFLYARSDTNTLSGSDIVIDGTPITMTTDAGGYDIIGSWPGATTFITMGYLNDLYTDFGYNSSGSARTCPVLNTFTSNPLATTASAYITASAFRGRSRFYLTSALHASGSSGTNGLPIVMANTERSLYMAIIPTPTSIFIIFMKRFANGSLVDMAYKYAISTVSISPTLSTDAWHSIMFSLNLDSTTGGVAAGSVLGIDGNLYTSFSVTTSSEGSPSLAGLTAALQVSGYVTDLAISNDAPLGTATTYPTRSVSFIP